MMCRKLARCGVSVIAALAAATNAFAVSERATTAPFDTGRFLSVNGEVYAGIFGSSVTVETLTVGEATYRAQLDELIEVASVRIYVSTDQGAEPMLLTDEQLASGEFGVAFGLGREFERTQFATALDVMQGLDLAKMLFTDGSRGVRVDVLLAVPLRDSAPGEFDLSPEALLLGSFANQQVRLGAIIGGNIDQPILAQEPVEVDPNGFLDGRTGVSIVTDVTRDPQPIAIVGLDLSVLGIGDETAVIGYRLEIGPGAPAMFNLIGVGRDWQRDLATPIATLEEPQDFEAVGLGFVEDWAPRGGFGTVGLAMSQPLARGPLLGGSGFRGSGGGSGGGGGLPRGPFSNGDQEPGDDHDDGGDDGDPPVPAPGTLIILLGYGLTCGSRRRRC